MHKIDTDTAVDGEFVPGNSSTAQQATKLNASWFNSVQRELVNLLEKNGVTLSKTNDQQLYTLFKNVIKGLFSKVVVSGDDGDIEITSGEILFTKDGGGYARNVAIDFDGNNGIEVAGDLKCDSLSSSGAVTCGDINSSGKLICGNIRSGVVECGAIDSSGLLTCKNITTSGQIRSKVITVTSGAEESSMPRLTVSEELKVSDRAYFTGLAEFNRADFNGASYFLGLVKTTASKSSVIYLGDTGGTGGTPKYSTTWNDGDFTDGNRVNVQVVLETDIDSSKSYTFEITAQPVAGRLISVCVNARNGVCGHNLLCSSSFGKYTYESLAIGCRCVFVADGTSWKSDYFAL